MADLKVNDGGTVKTPERIFTVGASNTLYQVNYVVANNASQTPVTVWDAIFATSRTTTFNTTTSFTTTFATTRDTTQTTSTSFTTSFSTTASTSASTTTTFATGHQTQTTFNTSRSTTTSYTTSYNTSRSTSRSTTGGWGSYQYQFSPLNYAWYTSVTSGTPGSSSYQLYWNGSQIAGPSGGAGTGAATTTLVQVGSYQYQRGSLQYTVTVKSTASNYYQIRRRYNTTTSFTTTFGTSNTTSRSTTTTFSTNNLTATSFNTSRSTTTTFDTALGTSGTTSQDTTTTFSTSFDTTNTTSQDTATSNATTVYERVTATGAETEVSSAGAHNIRYWDGSQWTEE